MLRKQWPIYHDKMSLQGALSISEDIFSRVEKNKQTSNKGNILSVSQDEYEIIFFQNLV